MKDFQSAINSLLKDHKNRKRYLAFLLALSMIVSVAVPFSLIVPAVSMTMSDAEMIYAMDTAPAGATNIADADTITVSLEKYDGSTNWDPNGSASDSVECSFALNFGYEGLGGITDTQPYLYFQMPDGLKILRAIDNEYYYDEGYSSTVPAGYLSISENGLVVFELTAGYIAYLKEKAKLTGFFNFDARIYRADNGDGDQTFSFGGTELTIPFKDKELSLEKRGSLDASNENDMKVNWTIDITNQDETWDLDGYTVTDIMLANGKDIRIDPDYVGSFDPATKVITLNANASNTENIHITYYTELDSLNSDITNKAVLKDRDGIEKDGDEETVEVGKIVNVTKTGKPDYQIDGAGIDNKIQWTVNVVNQYGHSLNGYILEDTLFPEDVSEISPSGLVVKENGVYKLNTTEKEVTLTYWANATENNWNNNRIVVKQPDEGSGDEDNQSTWYEQKSNLFNLTKNGNYDKSKHLITWEIIVSTQNNNTQSLKNYTLTDTQFANAIDGITVNPSIDFSLVDSTLTINSDTDRVTFTYQTQVTEEIAEIANANNGNVTNDVDLNEPNNPDPIKETTGYANNVWRFENSLTKATDYSNQTTYYTNGEIKADIKWTVNITKEAGLAGETFTDTLTLPEGVTLKEVKDILLQVRADQYNGEWKTVTVTPVISGNTFTITLPDNIASEDIYAQLMYVTTVTIPGVEESAYNNANTISYRIDNIGVLDNKSSETSATITRENPNKQESMNVTVQKAWDDENSSNRPKEITIQLTRDVQTKTYDANGSLSTSGNWEPDTTFDTITKVFSDREGWTYLNTLEKTKSITENGITTQYSYKYKVIEASYQDANGNDVLISNNQFVVNAEEGYYQVSYGNNGELSNSGDIQITNKLIKNDLIEIGVNKRWSDDIPADDMPDSITVQLERYENGSFKEVLDTQILTAGNWTYTWNVLPKQSVKQNGADIEIINYSYRVKEVSVTKDDKIYPISTSNTFAITPNGSYSVTYDKDYGINSSDTINITNTFTPVNTISVGVKKIWENDNEESRPKNITVQLYRKVGNNDWEAVPDKTVTLDADRTWQWEDTFTDLPAEVLVVHEDGTFSKETCYYRVIECAYDGMIIAGSSFEYGDGSYQIKYSYDGGYNHYSPEEKSDMQVDPNNNTVSIKNIFTETVNPVSKSAVDANGNKITSVQLSDLEKITMVDGEYYVLNWWVQINENITNCTFVDELPTGFTLCDSSATSSPIYYEQDPLVAGSALYYNFPLLLNGQGYGGNDKLKITTNGKDVTFDWTAQSGLSEGRIVYSTKIPVADLENLLANGSYDVVNTATANGVPDTATLTVKKNGGTDVPPDQDLLSKTGSGNNQLSNVTYTLDVNPEGKTLSNDGEFDITDTFNTVSYNGQTGNALVDANLTSIKVYDADTGMELPAGVWGYQIAYSPSTETVVDITDQLSYSSGYIGNWSGNSFSNVEMKVKYVGTSGEEVYFSIDGINKEKNVCDEYGVVYYTFSLTSFMSGEQIRVHLYHTSEDNSEFYDYSMSFDSASYTKVEVSSVANLVLTVPDARHLRIEYTYKLLKNGAALQEGDKITVNNSASFNTGNASSNATADEISMEIQKASGGTSAVGNPTIVKVDAGNYSINNLNATFKFAKYTSESGWQYLTNIGADSPHVIPDNGWGAESDAIEISVAGSYPMGNMESGVLYRLTEISAPTEQGYEPTTSPNFTKDYYFVYNSTEFAYPTDMTSAQLAKVMRIKAGGNITIPNNKLLTIEAEKAWYEAPKDWSVDFELYWSYQKANTIPSSAQPVHDLLQQFGLPAEYQTTQEVTENQKATWKNLPNGMDGQPIYYYVKEVAYAIDGVTYTWDEASEKFLNGTVEGEYKPHYTNNAANTDRTGEDAIIVTNNKGLVIRKEWLNSDNTEMTVAPKDEIHFTLYGKNAQGETISLGVYTLGTVNGWSLRLSDISSLDLSGYTEFKVVEDSVDGYGYTISYTYAVEDNVGEIKIVNKDNTPTEITVNVEKEWADGAELHANDSIDVKLYRVSRSLTDAEYTALQDGTLQLPLSNTIFEELTAQQVTLDTANAWNYTWNELPYKGSEEDNSSVSRWFYYPIEVSTTLTDTSKTYTPVYSKTANTVSAQGFKIRNILPGSLQIEKQWKDTNGNSVTNVNCDSVTVEVFRRALESRDESDTSDIVLPNSLSVICAGDSITKGTFNDYVQEEKTYPNVLGSEYLIERNGYSNVTVSKVAENGEKINGIKSAIQYDSSNPDIVLLIAGTNDIINSNDSIETMQANFESLLTEIYKKNPEAVFVGTIPRFKALSWGNSRGIDQVSDWETDDSKRQAVQKQWDDWVSSYNTMVTNVVNHWNETEKTIYLVDVKTAVGDSLCDGCHPDENGYAEIAKAFYQKINAHYTGNEGGNITNTKTPTNVNYCPTDLTESEKVGEYEITPDENGNWSLNITDLDKANAEGVSYVYYAREKPVDGWTPTYADNGQIIGAEDATPIIITNTKQDIPIDITVEKKWNDGNGLDRPANLTLTLQRSTDQQGWTDTNEQTPQPDKNGNMWTYTYTGLPSENADGEKFFYRIVETVPAGYILFESNNDGISIDSTDKTIMLTNTKTVSLEIEKEWVDGENAYIEVNVYRSTVPNTQEMPLITTTEASGVSTTLVTTTTTVATTTTATTESTEPTETTPSTTEPEGDSGSLTGDSIYSSDGIKLDQSKAVQQIEFTYVSPSHGWAEGTIHIVDENGTDTAIKVGFFGDSYSGTELRIQQDDNFYKEYASGNVRIAIEPDSNIVKDGNSISQKFVLTLVNACKLTKLYIQKGNTVLNQVDYTITYVPTTYSLFRSTVVNLVNAPQAMAIDGSEQVGDTITISKAQHPNWTYTLENLPAYDESGAVYYYWLEEVSVPGYQTSYSFTDADGNTTYCVNAGQLTGSTGNVKILNSKTDTSGVVMPSTGSTGTAGYTKAGGAIMLMSTAVYILTKRRKKKAS